MASACSGGLGGSKACEVLVVGVGNVGAGIVEAFARSGWQVTAVDPSDALVPVVMHYAPYVVSSARIEDMAEPWLRNCLVRCSTVVYAAECGNRDAYASFGGETLARENLQRFDAFARRVSAARLDCHISYVGGSWTRREPRAGPDGAPLVDDESPAKLPDDCSPYELAKCTAHDAARELSSALRLPITFYDWASIVPNLAPNFTVSRMAAAAVTEGRVEFSGGDFGRPLLHRSDAGRCLVAVTEARIRAAEGERPLFDVVLLPGAFTPFVRFAEVVCETAAARMGKEVTRYERAGETPETLRTKCCSERLAALGFVADVEAVESGLREGCVAGLAAATVASDEVVK